MKEILGLASVILIGITLYMNGQSEISSQNQFQQWQSLHSKFYTQIEEQYRRMIFEQNKKMIDEHNANPENTYTMALNQFADLTTEEFVATYLDSQLSAGLKKRSVKPKSQSIPNEAYDWRNTTSVRDMKSGCISSWAFSTVGAAESYLTVVKSQKLSLSPQQLLDCDATSFSCNGGVPYKGLNYIADNGITVESVYPYTAKFSPCKREGGPYTINGNEDVDDLKSALRQYGVSVFVDATNWQFYSKGIFSNCEDNVNFAATAIGFTETYWIVQSSYGTSWGQNGYIYLAPGDTCGIESFGVRAI
ncbi:unnamed protein product (macronuclear) [Paramecium tetraurelia]|uniref:cathepsin L n=1 Tax=Paramecium tetraurelia TaxID=5888 RepID=A0BLR4_PARTE|nr:uncharacterized protein GSPATT00030115001 [Paramecium tetraurelia]CAK59481.1 unnamed protein product [Paramecium tetraurelia]|eukprot:XP_001426879.1 hypothetical protein (macronuclear) [Paramecium tetraurelia strain d4-2]